jgi:hypothetical protein
MVQQLVFERFDKTSVKGIGFSVGIFPEKHQSMGEVTLGRLRILFVMYFRFVYAIHNLWDVEIQIILSIFARMQIWIMFI